MAEEKGIVAYHGSPHDFDRFSTEHIGAGEGAQAYGHGLYFAENEGVAKSYQQSLSGHEIDKVPVGQFLEQTPKIETICDALREGQENQSKCHDRGREQVLFIVSGSRRAQGG